MTVQWRPGIPLDLARLKEAVLRWRGAVRYGGAVVTVVGVIEDPDGAGSASTTPLLRALGTAQRFSLHAGAGGADPAQLRRGEAVRITGRVIKSKEGKDDQIWLELERDSSQK